MSIIRCVLAITGIVLVLASLLLRRDDEGYVRNRLVDWWVGVTLKGETTTTKLWLAATAASRAYASGLTWLFGDRVLSLRSLWVSFWLSITNVGLAIALSDLQSSPWGFVSQALQCLGLALLPSLYRLRSSQNLTLSFLALAIGWPKLSSVGDSLLGDTAFDFLWLPLALAVASDIIFLAIQRRLLQRVAAGSKRAAALLAMVLGSPVIFLGLALLGAQQISKTFDIGSFLVDSDHPDQLPWELFVVACVMNAVAVLSAIICGIGILCIALNVAFWSVLSRLFENAHERFPERKSIGAAGLLLIGASFSESILKIAKFIVGAK